ncbi:MAG: hypothetical protein NC123_20095 [Butyrivibrio sp.]|nr:hypothetical protein [Butyrivibrio sp.]
MARKMGVFLKMLIYGEENGIKIQKRREKWEYFNFSGAWIRTFIKRQYIPDIKNAMQAWLDGVGFRKDPGLPG